MKRTKPYLVCLLIIFVTLLLASPAYLASTRAVVISEIAWMGTAVSANDEWIELTNNTDQAIDLTNWTLFALDNSPEITLNVTIPANGHLLLERTDDTTVPGVTADQIYTGSLANDGETLMLRDENDTLIDQIDAAGGWFAGHVDARVPMVRVNPLSDGNSAANWTYNPRCGDATNSAGDSHTCELNTVSVGEPLDYAVYFNERAATADATTSEPTVIEQALLNLINTASTSIDVALFDLDRQRIVDALIAAKNRGVTVQVVGDDEESQNEQYSGSYESLSTNGITVITDTAEMLLQHNKFLVFDNQTVWTGSTNFTDNGLTLNANNSLAITNTLLADAYATEFNEMWNSKFHTDKVDNTTHLFEFDGTLVESYFSPTDQVAFAVWEALETADETIHFAMFAWTDTVLSDRVIERMEAGVTVQGIWENFSGQTVREILCDSGAHIKREDLAGRVHHKFAVIDAYGSDPTVITGSYNWSHNGAYENDENTLIIHDAALAQLYLAEWQRLSAAIPFENLCNPFTNFLPMTIRP